MSIVLLTNCSLSIFVLTEEENLRKLDERISKFKLKDIVVCFDFDECVVPVHLTQVVTTKVSRPIDKDLMDKIGWVSFEGIKHLMELQIGTDYASYCIMRDKIAKETPWREGFEELLKRLAKEYSVVFISCGIKDVCYAKLKEIGFDSDNILADEFLIVDGKISEVEFLVTDELKGYTVRELKKSHKVFAVGHGFGDKVMLDNADVSISIDEEIAQHNVKTAKEVYSIISQRVS